MENQLKGAIALLGVMAAMGCADGVMPTTPTAIDPPGALRRSLTEPGIAHFKLRGASYGPDGEEVTSSNCNSLYDIQRDSTNWAPPAWDPVWVRTTKETKVGCIIGTGGGGGVNIVGGEATISLEGPNGYSHFAAINADQAEYADVTNVPATGTTVYLSAQAWDGFDFMYWTIRRGDGTQYRDYSRDLVRAGDTSDYEFFAEFKQPWDCCGL